MRVFSGAFYSNYFYLCQFAERKNDKESREMAEEPTRLEKAIVIIYRWLLFPTVAGFWLVLSLSGYVNNRRLSVEHEGFFASSFGSSLAMLLAWGAASCVFFFEVCYCNEKKYPLSGEQKVSSWYVPLFLLRIASISLLLQLGISL
jgi:hypothetical protein